MNVYQAYWLARKGSAEQKEMVIKWAYSEVPSMLYHELCDITGLSMDYLNFRDEDEPMDWFSSDG